MRLARIALLVAISMIVSPDIAVSASGDKSPDIGIVYNTTENSSITYNCSKDGDTLNCSFVQVSIRHKAKQEDLEDKLSKARLDFKSEESFFSADSCNGMAELLK